jgi:hypothetical protein
VGADDGMRSKCYDAIAKYSAQLDYSEAHFWNEQQHNLDWWTNQMGKCSSRV